MEALYKTLAAFGRVCVSAIFIVSGTHKILSWQESELALMNGICDLMKFMSQEGSKACLQLLLPWVPLLLLIAALIELIGGLCLLFGYKVRFAAVALMLFLIPTTLLFHSFWYQDADAKVQAQIAFLNNLALFGGLLNVFAFGTGRPKPSPDPKN